MNVLVTCKYEEDPIKHEGARVFTTFSPLYPYSAPVICIPGSLGAGDSGDIAGPKCRDLTFDESRQCGRCAGVLISRQNTNLCHILTTRGKLSLYICTV